MIFCSTLIIKQINQQPFGQLLISFSFKLDRNGIETQRFQKENMKNNHLITIM